MLRSDRENRLGWHCRASVSDAFLIGVFTETPYKKTRVPLCYRCMLVRMLPPLFLLEEGRR